MDVQNSVYYMFAFVDVAPIWINETNAARAKENERERKKKMGKNG